MLARIIIAKSRGKLHYIMVPKLIEDRNSKIAHLEFITQETLNFISSNIENPLGHDNLFLSNFVNMINYSFRLINFYSLTFLYKLRNNSYFH